MRLVAALVVVSGLLGSPLVRAAEPQWVEVRSPNFSVITDAGDRRGRDVALYFEQMRSVFGALSARAKVNLPVPLQIVAFRSSTEMLQVAPIFNGKATASAGLFESGEDRSFIILDMSGKDPWRTVFHEYAHRLMDGNFSFHADPWFEEGFAEYFSTIEVGKKKALIGQIPEPTYRTLQQTAMMGVSELFRVQKTSTTYNEDSEHRTTFYAESALVVHYLYDHHLVPKVEIYFDALRTQKKPVEQAIQSAFGMTAEQFDEALRSYLKSGRSGHYPVPTAPKISPAQFTARSVSDADALAVIADIHAHSPDYRDKALGEFQDVLKMDPDNAAALRGAGFACMQQKDYEQAEEYLQRAAVRDKKDPRVHYYYALLLNQESPPDDPQPDEIKKELEMTIALDPTMADAYSLLGFTQAMSGEPAKGIATLNKALELSPRNENYTLNLASAYLAAGRVDTAISIFRNMTSSMNPEIAARARQGLEQATQVKEQSGRLELRVEKEPEGHAENGKGNPENASGLKTVVVLPAMHFIRGKVVKVDCSLSPQAVLTVTAGEKSLRVHVADSSRLVVIGADEFSCGWAGRAVAVNYHERADGDGEAVSIELQ